MPNAETLTGSNPIIQEKKRNSRHQYIISEGTTLTVYNDGTGKNNQNQNICLAFTIEKIEKAYRKVQALGA